MSAGTRNPRRIIVMGLDCAEPSLVFDRWRDRLPTLDRLMRLGGYGRLESVIPPITVPAWMCMFTGASPGRLGIYGFRNRTGHHEHRMEIATSQAVGEETVWEIAGRHGLKSVVVGVPQTYPVRPFPGGHLVSSFLTPGPDAQFTHPASLGEEITGLVGRYIFDVDNFRTHRKERLLEQIHTMTRRRFKVLRHLISDKPWDLFAAVEMGVDRIHHGFWRYSDPQHPAYEPGHPLADAILEYYLALDREIARLLELAPRDAVVLVVSDHGAKALHGCVRINHWLIQKGYLALHTRPSKPSSIDALDIDWSKTTAWAEGGYYARIFLNVEGREPDGIIPAGMYEETREALRQRLEAMMGPDGRPLENRAYRPEDLYTESRGTPPDLLVILGDLAWRSAGTVSDDDALFTTENDQGPDDANHAQHGILIHHDPLHPGGGKSFTGLHLQQVAPTLLSLLGLEIPEVMDRPPLPLPGVPETGEPSKPPEGVAGSGGARSPGGYTPEEEERMRRHLEDLGYL